MPKDDYKLLLRVGDLFIDTRNYGSHTVASDALMQHTPVLTLPGKTFASRVATSILVAAGFGVATLLEANSEKDWFAIASRLLVAPGSGGSGSGQGALRQRLRQSVLEHRCLGNSTRFASRIERAALSLLEVEHITGSSSSPGSGLLSSGRRTHIFFPSSLSSCGGF
jgi:predicted O-linked N-acetylglucosamine transferase (SPINDLY family)